MTERERETDRERERDSELQPPFDPSVGSLCHPCTTATHVSYSFLSVKPQPPPCTVLLVFGCMICMAIGRCGSPFQSSDLSVNHQFPYQKLAYFFDGESNVFRHVKGQEIGLTTPNSWPQNSWKPGSLPGSAQG